MSALRDYIVGNPELSSTNTDRKYNRFIDDTWFWIFPKNNANEEFSLNFKEIFCELAPYNEIFAKQVLMPNPTKSSSLERELADGRFTSAKFAVDETVRILQTLFIWHRKYHPNGRLSDMTTSQVENMFSALLRIDKYKGQLYPGLRSHKVFRRYLEVHQKWQKAYQSGLIVDGISVPISISAILEKLVKHEAPKIAPHFDYAVWKKGSKLDGLSIPQQIALLMQALEFLRSDKTKLVIALTRFTHQGYLLHTSQYRVGGLVSTGTVKDNNPYIHFRNSARRDCLLKELSAKFGGETWEDLPKWLNSFAFKFSGGKGRPNEFRRHQDNITTAALIVFMILSGARRSELEHLSGSDIEIRDDGTATFRTYIFKTNQGIGAIRYIGGIIAEVTDVLRDLKGYVDPEFQDPLFKVVKQKLSGGKRPNRASKGNLLHPSGIPYFIDHYVNPFLDETLKITNFKPHSCRHAWAEFALRRFEGNSVPELIRQHFRHAYGSYMTDNYIMGKVFEEDSSDLQMDYIRELIGRAAEGSERLYGPVGDYIKGMIGSFEFIGEDEIEQIAETFEGFIEPHEYGFCVVRPEMYSQAQCFNKESQLAETTLACWEKCGGCVNRLTLPAQREDIHRLGISAKASMDSFKKLGLIPLSNAYNFHLKLCAAALKEIDEGEKAHV
ncbi:hypothetical protein ACT3R7_19065 [Halomonas sp. AOP43-A1-21]